MRNISLGQIMIALLLSFFLFGDLTSLKNYIKIIVKKSNFINNYTKDKKKGD